MGSVTITTANYSTGFWDPSSTPKEKTGINEAQWAEIFTKFPALLVSINECQPPPPRPRPFDFVAWLTRQREFSLKTFGPGLRTKGMIDHIRKELDEIEADPTDLMEWADVAILALDGAWRAGWSPEEIAGALRAKLEKNQSRKWPDWRTSEPDKAISHIPQP